MNILEKDLEEIIEKASIKELNSRGLHVVGKPLRQLRIGDYGIADLVYVRKDYELIERGVGYTEVPYLNINICELKKDKAGISAFLQAVRYAKGIKQYLESRGFYNYKLQITLIAPKIDTNSDYIFLTDLIRSRERTNITQINNYSVTYNFNGIQFKDESGYSLINNKF